jgi:hypothetical protein
LEGRDTRRERRRQAAEQRRFEAARRQRREEEEAERRREAEDEEDEDLRNNFAELLNGWNFRIAGQALEPPLPTKSEVRAAMKPSNHVISETNLCTICLTAEQRTVVELGCGHAYHRRCAKRWLRKRLTCPLCNQPC